MIVAILIMSCSKKPDTIGLDLVNEDTPVIGYDTTIEVSAYSTFEESVASDETSVNLLGSMTTETFGMTSASFYTQIRTAILNPEFNENTEIDSVILTMVYSDAYGNINTEQNLKIFRLTDSLSLAHSYFSDTSFNIEEAYTYADFSFFPDTNKIIIVDTTDDDTTFQAARLKINLNEYFAQDILNLGDGDTSVWNSQENFVNAFKGLYIQSENITTSGEGGILSFDLLSDYSNITMYYKNSEEDDSLSHVFNINLNCARVGRYEHDYSLITDPDFVVQGDSIIGNDYIFLQCLGGINAELKFPGIKAWAESGSKVINEAKITFSLAEETTTEYPPSKNLIFFKNTESGGFDFMRDQLQGEDYFGGKYNSSSRSYTFRIALHLQDLIAGEMDLGAGLFPNAKSIKASQMKFFGLKNGEPRSIKLQITYTDLE
jgi:hypothetical protein